MASHQLDSAASAHELDAKAARQSATSASEGESEPRLELAARVFSLVARRIGITRILNPFVGAENGLWPLIARSAGPDAGLIRLPRWADDSVHADNAPNWRDGYGQTKTL